MVFSRFTLFLADYNPHPLKDAVLDEERKTIRIGRTETLDWVLESLKTPGRIVLPRRSSEVDEFAKEVSSIAKVLEEDASGNRTFKYRKTGPADHYAHAMGYLLWAATKIGLSRDARRQKIPDRAITDFNVFEENYGIAPEDPWR